MNRKTLIPIAVLLIGLTAGFIAGTKTGNESILTTMQKAQTSLMEADSLLIEARAVMARQDSCLIMCHEQGMYTYNQWMNCAKKRVEDLDLWRKASLPDSTVLIDGLLYERAVRSNTAHNNGVGVPFKGVEL